MLNVMKPSVTSEAETGGSDVAVEVDANANANANAMHPNNKYIPQDPSLSMADVLANCLNPAKKPNAILK